MDDLGFSSSARTQMSPALSAGYDDMQGQGLWRSASSTCAGCTSCSC